jgi:hypothetical protein
VWLLYRNGYWINSKIRIKNTATKFIENGVSGGDNRSTGVTGSIQCILTLQQVKTKML